MDAEIEALDRLIARYEHHRGGTSWNQIGSSIRNAEEVRTFATTWQAMLIEAALTAGLVSTILGTASGAQNVGALSAVAVAGYIVLAGLWSSPVSGASMNPARSFGPDLANGDFTDYWVYIVGPIVGAMAAVGIAYILRGRGGDVGGTRAARGAE